MKKNILTFLILALILAYNSYALAADIASQESSTSSPDCQYIVDFRAGEKKAADDLKNNIAKRISDLSESVVSLPSRLEANRLKYAGAENSATLGDLYGASPKLLNVAYKKTLFLDGVTAVSDNQHLNKHASSKFVSADSARVREISISNIIESDNLADDIRDTTNIDPVGLNPTTPTIAPPVTEPISIVTSGTTPPPADPTPPPVDPAPDTLRKPRIR